MKKKILLFIFVFISAQQLWAYRAPIGHRSPRGLLMGDAYTAVNNDDFTLFYNPASLARHKADFTLYPLNATIGVNNVLNDYDRFEDFPDNPVGVADLIMNYPVHVAANITPGFRLFNFGFSFITSEQVDILLQNKIDPIVNIDYRSDRGFQVGQAIILGSNRISRKTGMGSQLSLGVGAKFIKRRGLFDSLSLTGTDFLNAIAEGAETEDTLEALGLVESQAWGFDGGMEYVTKNGPSQFVFGIAALDIGDTTFTEKESEDDHQVADNNDQVNLGIAWTYDVKFFDITLSSDVRNLTEEMDLMQRMRFGVKIGVPGLAVMAGMNSGYYSYGATLDFFFMKVTAGFFGVEAGSRYKRIKSDQAVIYLSLFDFSFDA